jgi:DNA-directed RNA polymerase subunit beta'
MKAVDLLMQTLDPDLKDTENAQYDAKYIGDMMSRLARRDPDLYRKAAEVIGDRGRDHAYWSGTTLSLEDFEPVVDKGAIFAEMDAELEEAKKTTPAKDWKNTRLAIWGKYMDRLDAETKAELLARGNNLANTMISGARGKPKQISAMVTTPGLYADYKGNVIPYFIRESFAEGVRPAAILAGSFGARSAIISTKASTAEAGHIGKMLFQGASNLVVTEDDCGTGNGILVDGDENPRGSVLLQDVGDIKAGTLVDKKVAAQLRKHKGPVKVRSVLTCESQEGICSKCLGKVPTNSGLAPVGYSAGTTAATALAEPMAQGSLNAKHGGGAYGGEKKTYSGMHVVEQFLDSPETFEDRTALAQISGTVKNVEEAPQGGNYVTLFGRDGEEVRHYVPATLDVTVKNGDQVERGRPLSSGLTDVEDVIALRGLGEGRKYFARRLGQILGDSGIPTSRSNLELLSRALIDHVQIDDPKGYKEYVPDEIVSFSKLYRDITPKKDAQMLPLEKAVGKKLQSNVLHHTVGTEILPSMLDEFRSAGIDQLAVSDRDFKFKPTMVGIKRTNKKMKDWLARQSTSYLKNSLQDDAASGRDTNVLTNTHFAPTLAYGTEFAKKIDQTGEF